MNDASTKYATTGSHTDIATICIVVARCLELAPGELAAETDLVKDIGIDSIDRLALAVELEERFDVAIPDDALHRLRTIGDISPCIAVALGLRELTARNSAALGPQAGDDVIAPHEACRVVPSPEEAPHVRNESH